VKLLIDHNLPPRLAVALHTIFEPEHEIVSLWTKFGRHNLKDEDWIPALGEEGSWAVLSADLNIARKRPSRELFIRAGLVGFFFSPAMQKWPLSRQTARVLTIWPQMISHVSTTANGVFEMPASGHKFRTIGR
jgi:hypothetical protein